MATGRPDAARRELETTLKTHPSDVAVNQALAYLNLATGRVAEAEPSAASSQISTIREAPYRARTSQLKTQIVEGARAQLECEVVRVARHARQQLLHLLDELGRRCCRRQRRQLIETE